MPKARFAALALLALAAPAAEATLPDAARFEITLAGVPIGEATLAARLGGGRYAVEAAADVGFLFWGGKGGATAEGAARDARLEPARYALRYEGATRPGGVDIAFENGRAARHASFPPVPPEYAEGRVPVTQAHLDGVADPLSAFVIPAPADADPAALCRRTLAVFNGYTRFDIRLDGPRAALSPGVVACAATYVPVAGHRPESPGVARLRRPGALDVTLAPLAPGLWGPQRIGVATRFGTLEILRR